MIVNVGKTYIEVLFEEGDLKFYGIAGARGESRFLYAVLQKLRAMGYDCIKKRAAKDGHLVDDMQQYIRDRTGKWFAYNDHWAINGLEEDFNQGCAMLRILGEAPVPQIGGQSKDSGECVEVSGNLGG